MTTNATKPENRLVGLRAGGHYLGMSYWSLRDLVLSGRIPHLRLGRKILIDRRDLDQWIQTNKQVGV